MRTVLHFSLLLAAVLCPPMPLPHARAAQRTAAVSEYLVYVGTYTGKKSKSQGIYVYRFNAATGKATSIGLAAETGNPSFLAVSPNRRFLYAVGEAAGRGDGTVSAFGIDLKSGKLTFLNKASSRGSGPCYVRVDNTGKNALVANYNSGSVAVLPIKEDGSLAEASSFVQHVGQVADPKRQGGPHAHSINPSPDNRFAMVADLGLDKVFVYRFDAVKGTLAPNDPPFATVAPRSGPRHFAFHPSGKFAYVINEIMSTVTAFSYDAARGVLTPRQTISTLPEGFKGESDTAEVQVHPSGKFLYGSNRGHDSIAVFSIDASKGTLTPVEHVPTQGKTPRNFGIDPTGSYLFAANQDTGNIVVFRIDAKTGKLTPTGDVLQTDAPVCVKFVAVQ